MTHKWLISIFDYTGNASRPYRENGWDVTQIDIQLGTDFMKWNYCAALLQRLKRLREGDTLEIGIICMMPCTDYAVSGARHFAEKDQDGRTRKSQRLVKNFKKMLEYLKENATVKFWQLENPRTRIHALNQWLGKPLQKFNPCDFAGYDPEPDNSRYNKETWLFGEFNKMEEKKMTPFMYANPGWRKYGGKSLKTKNARSVTPLGFAYAFYESNH